MPSIWDLPQQEPQRGPAMDEARRRAVAMLGLLGAGLPSSSDLDTSALLPFRAHGCDVGRTYPRRVPGRASDEGYTDRNPALLLELEKAAFKLQKKANDFLDKNEETVA